ncbi:MAG: histidinol-phosphatase HisJ family protein [Christensenellales bacterium]|jgi:histidinol-phosphatase (PHP family)
MFDYHLHSAFSADAQVPLEEMARHCAQAGLSEICFTEHIDLGLPPHREKEWIVDLDAYLREVARVGGLFPEMRVRCGIEAGYTLENISQMEQLLAEHGLDYVIGSRHILEGMDIFYAGYVQEDRSRVYALYLEEVLDTMRRVEHFSVLGHIDYPSKLSVFCDAPMRYEDAPDLIDEILKMLVQKGKGMEVNTSSLRKTKDMSSITSILKRFCELGGEIVTFGSDAHRPEDVVFLYEQAMGGILQAGFGYIATFEKMKPVFHPIGG